jgi:hypothetical protein
MGRSTASAHSIADSAAAVAALRLENLVNGANPDREARAIATQTFITSSTSFCARLPALLARRKPGQREPG